MAGGDYVHVPGEVISIPEAGYLQIAPQYNMTHLQYKKLYDDAIAPHRAHEHDLGYDLFARETVVIHPGMKQKVSTGIAFEFPSGWGGFVKDRSSMAANTTLETIAGVIDNSYEGELFIMFANYGNGIQTIEVGQKIAQIVLIPVPNFPLREVDEITSKNLRKDRGFGSTGR